MKAIINNLIKLCIKAIFAIISQKKNNKLLYFESFHGKQYSDNPRALYEYLNQNTDNNLIWGVKKGYESVFEKHGVPYVIRFSLKWFLTMPKAKIWIINTRLPQWFYKSSKTIYLQTWHGTPLKKLGLDIEDVYMSGANTTKYKKDIIDESKRWDFLISPNKYSTDNFEKAFQINRSKIIETGYPRNDKLINEQNNVSYIQRIKDDLNIPPDKNVIMYAPTWRDDKFITEGTYELNLNLNIDKLRQQLGDDYVILLRMHYLVVTRFKENDNFIIDVSDYEDIAELYLISDILITDYSSVMFDFGVLKRPQIFYAYDLEDYDSRLRGFYMNYKNNLPGPIVYNDNDLIHLLKKEEDLKKKYNKELEQFYKLYCSFENGDSSKRVIDRIMK
ncbi:teichoic acid glycerol-phosphate transferase TarF [Staphylococcus epidermidis]|uniref:CDP-ribitol:poly(Ribitol phosphate) ribitol phosphotransferase n=1 Tax=Staphylococcus epidermidis TaxID=1282 RepID=D2JCX6_STAEP|nr:teichoic acid glycerol-phosphate transferase TarF [Staphylococcus epidermidis]ADA62589.1 CDP-ribitol:poly(ribitol phosphate) ribitol phosphotransferase [Staphylococcus epidermidis]MCG2105240.1 CDP-glycerol glycerophosphotransferase family protein [Staphylococcus epidermidis]MCG2123564.1 CDP-glycerol glycerophosphotransferase family protein [Staphylococcus epidermidis]